MIQELKVLAALTDASTIDEAAKDDQASYIRRLEDRLRTSNVQVRQMVKALMLMSEVQPDDIKTLVNELETTLSALPLNEAKAYMATQFTPDRCRQIEKQSAATARAIRKVLRDFCELNNLPHTYAIWGQD